MTFCYSRKISHSCLKRWDTLPKIALMWNRTGLYLFFLLLTVVCHLKMWGILNLLKSYICFLWCKNKPSLKLVDRTTNFWFRLAQMCLLLCNLYGKACKAADKWTSLSIVSSYLSGEGLASLVLLHDSYESLTHLSISHDTFIRWSREESGHERRQCLSTLPPVCDNGWERRDISLLICLQILKWSGAPCVPR